MLEDEYDRVRHFKVESKPQGEGDGNGEAPAAKPEIDQDMEETDDEPREKGADAVERRIAKLHEELPQPADENDMWMWENKKVWRPRFTNGDGMLTLVDRTSSHWTCI